MERREIVTGYCRVSTLEQKKKGYGIDIQVRDIKRYSEIFGLKVDDFYVDEAKSGASENRRELRRLIRDCKAGKVKAIIVSSLDRLSRDLKFTENLLHDLHTLGVKVFIADMPHYDGNNRKDVLIRQIVRFCKILPPSPPKGRKWAKIASNFFYLTNTPFYEFRYIRSQCHEQRRKLSPPSGKAAGPSKTGKTNSGTNKPKDPSKLWGARPDKSSRSILTGNSNPVLLLPALASHVSHLPAIIHRQTNTLIWIDTAVPGFLNKGLERPFGSSQSLLVRHYYVSRSFDSCGQKPTT